MTEHALREAPATGEVCLPRELRKPRLRRVEAVEYLMLVHGIPIAVTTLNKLASVGGGPEFEKFNRTPLYPRDKLDEWARMKLSRPVRSTSEADIVGAGKCRPV